MHCSVHMSLCGSECGSEWTDQGLPHEDAVKIMRKQIASLTVQLRMMAAHANQPMGVPAHHAAARLQAVVRRRSARDVYVQARRSVVRVQTAWRRFAAGKLYREAKQLIGDRPLCAHTLLEALVLRHRRFVDQMVEVMSGDLNDDCYVRDDPHYTRDRLG